MEKLNKQNLIQLVASAFPRFKDDRRIAILIDIPRSADKDTPDWKARRLLAAEWSGLIKAALPELNLKEALLYAYPDVGSNNADLPSRLFRISEPPDLADGLAGAGQPVDLEEIYSGTQIFLAMTQFSTTAPLKVAARKFGFRAATMPGFSPKMVPALKIDYGRVSDRVMQLKDRLDRAEYAEVNFREDDGKKSDILFDLRHRTAHASTGRFPEPGTAGNLPSGEAYIVPYEGEQGEPSLTEGVLPVQIGREIVSFVVKANRAYAVMGSGPAADEERRRLEKEPAYGNMAELGFGVLDAFGVHAIGEILLDEKLGFHVAFGRSEHFGGIVGPDSFSSPETVIHLDQIYIPATQPKVTVSLLVLHYPDGKKETIIENGRTVIFS